MSKKKNNFKFNVRERVQSHRQLKVSNLVNVSLISCLRKGRGLDNKLCGCPLTITKVNISADLKVANCYFLPFNTTLSSDQILESLNRSKYVIRQYVTQEIKLKFSLELRFYYDAGFENVQLIDTLLRQIKK